MLKLSNYLKRNYIKKSNIINKLNADLYASIPPAFIPYCQVLNLENNILNIGADSPAWASKLRFYKAEIEKTFQQRYQRKLTQVKITISPNIKSIYAKQTKQKTPGISSNSAQKLISLANTVQHPPLREALLKLSRHSRKESH